MLTSKRIGAAVVANLSAALNMPVKGFNLFVIERIPLIKILFNDELKASASHFSAAEHKPLLVWAVSHTYAYIFRRVTTLRAISGDIGDPPSRASLMASSSLAGGISFSR